MKIHVVTEKLLEAMKQVAINKPNKYNPILKGVLIRGCENRLDITTTDLETIRSKSIRAATEEWGTFLVDASRLLEVLKSLPKNELPLLMEITDGTYTLGWENYKNLDTGKKHQGIVFKVARHTITLHAMDVAEYPNVSGKVA